MSNKKGIIQYWGLRRANKYPEAEEADYGMTVPCEKCGDVKTVFTEPLCNGCMAEEEQRRWPEIVNLTGHPIDFILNDGTAVTIPPAVTITADGLTFAARVPRLKETRKDIDYTQEGIPIVQKTWERDPENPLPAPRAGTYYVVSALVANAFPERSDLLCPETRKTRDGRVYAVALVRANKEAKQ